MIRFPEMIYVFRDNDTKYTHNYQATICKKLMLGYVK